MNFIGSISPPSLADSMVHHLAAPKYYAAIEGFPFVAINPWAMPGLLHVLFTSTLLLSDGLSCQIIVFLFSIMLLLAVYGIASKYFGKNVVRWCSTLESMVKDYDY